MSFTEQSTGVTTTVFTLPVSTKSRRIFGVQDLSADIQVSSPDGTGLSYSDERPGFCLR